MLFSYKTHIFSYLLLVLACLLITACTVSEPSRDEILNIPREVLNGFGNGATGGQPEQPEGQEISAEIQCADVTQDACGLLVTVSALDEDVELDIWVHAESGVQFSTNLDVVPESNNKEASINDVNLLAGETRSVLFPYQPSDVILPGAYNIIVTATDAESNVYANTELLVFVFCDDNGGFHLLQSQDVFNGKYVNSFVNGNFHVGYYVDMADGGRPDRGDIWVRVDSVKDDYEPTIEIESTGAVVFLEDVAWNNNVASDAQIYKPVFSENREKISRRFPPISNGGARVARIPFELDRNGRLLDGTYVFMVTLHEDGVGDRYERMPIVMELRSDPQSPDDHWFVPTIASAVRATATPNITVTITPSPTPDIMGSGGGGMPEQEMALSDGQENQCDVYAAVAFKQDKLAEMHWTRNIANYSGSLCDAYLEFIAKEVPISWSDFQQAMIFRHATIVDEDSMLVSNQNYIIPELDK